MNVPDGHTREVQDGAQARSLAEIVADVSAHSARIVREEIALAKAEVATKLSSLWRGALIAAAAGVFLLAAVVTALHAISLLIADLLGAASWVGYAVVTLLLVASAVVAGWVAWRLLRRGAPPTPELAIEEARRTRAEITGDGAGSISHRPSTATAESQEAH
ncbi:phage holin family protein [Thermoleophilum album]|uniref:Putative Holin-X, holin superfamily III n=1 Tax=Thermoleophilum album TaxID=29539 RepID=A0A1H6FQQ1_THEAL|nr:phage holin family protein [Thermoleophilum album]SEH12074.1 Putative Holin-X, holin superfamily III [Thermoleophilum album]